MVSSPYLEAIQSLGGVTPGDKFKKLNNLTNAIPSSSNLKDGIGDIQTVPTPLAPLARIPLAIRLKNNEFIIESLKSDDSFVINEALKAKFFFSPSNPDLKPKFFKENIMPYVSLQTRFKIIKKLSICLIKDEKNGEDFFNQFVEYYGIGQAVPLLIACSESFTYDNILKHKVVFPIGILEIIFRMKPDLVIRYLHLGNTENHANVKDRELHQIPISQYINFLPKLIKNHIQDFVALYECVQNIYVTLGTRKSILFIKNASDSLIQKPKVFLKLLDLKIVSKKLTEIDFETMLKNLFPKELPDFEMYNIINYVEYYPKDKKFDLLTKTFKEVYGVDILDDIKRVAYSDLLLLMPNSLREKQARRLIEEVKLDEYNRKYFSVDDWRCYLPPKDSIPLFKDLIKKESDMHTRSNLISKMIYSCHVYNDKIELNNVIKYYNERHKNEQAYVLQNLFSTLHTYWIKNLENSHWIILKEIVQRAFVKDELFDNPNYIIVSLMNGLLRNILQNSDKNMDQDTQDWYNKVLNIIIEFEIKTNGGKFNFLEDDAYLEQEVLNKILNTIPQIYPAENVIWGKKFIKFNIIINSLKSMTDFNSRHAEKFSVDYNSKNPDKIVKPFKLLSYPWLVNFLKEVMSVDLTLYESQELKRLLKLHDPEFYREIVFDNPSVTCRIENGEALMLLKRNPEKVIKNWNDYLEKAKVILIRSDKDHAARRFIETTKWYKDIPIYFVSHALEHLKDEGSILVLGILLEGKMFSKVITPLIPKEPQLDLDDETTKQYYKIVSEIQSAIIMTNPPCDLDIIAPFCQGEYLSLAIKCLSYVACRVPVPTVTEFAKRLMSDRVSVKKHGIRIISQVSPRKEWFELLTEMWNKEKHYSIREIIAVEIFCAFKSDTCEETFNLMKKCINEITVDDKTALESISDLGSIDNKYAGLYFAEMLKKIIDLSKNPNVSMEKYIQTILLTVDEKAIRYLEEPVFVEFYDRYFFVPDSRAISASVQEFVIKKYLLAAEGEHFESRLNLVSNNFEKVIDQYRVPLSKKLQKLPANATIYNFIKDLLKEMWAKRFANYEKVIEKFSKSFFTTLSPCQYPDSYILLEIYNIFFSNPSAKEFGLKCAGDISKFVKEFSTELIINDIVDCLSLIISHVPNYYDYKLTLIQGLIEGDKLYGSIVGIKLLSNYEVRDYDLRYESIIQTLEGSKDNIAIQYTINKFLNSLF